jgi:hypothetical protein
VVAVGSVAVDVGVGVVVVVESALMSLDELAVTVDVTRASHVTYCTRKYQLENTNIYHYYYY